MLEATVNQNIDEMESKFSDLQKAYDSLKEFCTDIDSYQSQDYFEYKDSIDEAKENCSSLPKEIHSLAREIDNYDLKRPDLLQKKQQKDIKESK